MVAAQIGSCVFSGVYDKKICSSIVEYAIKNIFSLPLT